MANESKFLIDKSTKFKTKPLWIFLSILILILIPFLIIWLLLGEFNLLNHNNLVAVNQVLWQGKITNENIRQLLVYERFIQTNSSQTFLDMLQKWLDKDTQIIANIAYFNWMLLIPLACLIVVGFVYPFCLRLFKLFAYDILPFSISFVLSFSVLFLCGLWPHFEQENMVLVYWLLRIIVFIVAMTITFFITNFIINKILSHGSNSVSIAINYFKQTPKKKS